MENLTIIESILRNRRKFFTEIRQDIDVFPKIRAMFLSCLMFLAIYGLVMGAAHSPQQAIASVVKLPVLFLATLLICAPSLHFFNILFGSKQTISQTVALTLTAISTTSVLLFSLAPITFFFLISTTEYSFFKLLNVIFFAMSGWLGIIFLRQGIEIVTEREDEAEGIKTRRLIFVIWVLLYGFVGSQMAWTISPLLGDPNMPFILLSQRGGNFYADVLNSIGTLLQLR
jgi:Yip1 domain